jgi:hypothetical protein
MDNKLGLLVIIILFWYHESDGIIYHAVSFIQGESHSGLPTPRLVKKQVSFLIDTAFDRLKKPLVFIDFGSARGDMIQHVLTHHHLTPSLPVSLSKIVGVELNQAQVAYSQNRFKNASVVKIQGKIWLILYFQWIDPFSCTCMNRFGM